MAIRWIPTALLAIGALMLASYGIVDATPVQDIGGGIVLALLAWGMRPRYY